VGLKDRIGWKVGVLVGVGKSGIAVAHQRMILGGFSKEEDGPRSIEDFYRKGSSPNRPEIPQAVGILVPKQPPHMDSV